MHPRRNLAWLLIIPLFAVLFLFLTAWLAAPTDLAVRYLGKDVLIIESSTGTDASFPLASTEGGGLMTSAQVQTLANLAAGSSGAGAGVPMGSSNGVTLRWYDNAWVAVSEPVNQGHGEYRGLSRTIDFAAVKAVVEHIYTHAGVGGWYPPWNPAVASGPFETWSWVVYCCYNTLNALTNYAVGTNNDQIENVWPSAGTNPYAWVLSPAWRTTTARGVSYEVNGTAVDQNAMTVQRNFLTIDGQAYDLWSVQVQGTSPAGLNAKLIFTYDAPALTATPVVAQP